MILALYILRNHLAPFLFSIFTLIFIFLFQFLMKFADRLVGKGLDTWVIIQLIMYNLAWMVVLVVPMAVLVATLMAFGSMSQNNEVTIMKSSGVSLYRMLSAPFLASILITYGLIVFNNDILPDANHMAKILMEDISRKKPTLSLESGVFSQEVSGYAILVREVDSESNKIKGITIYDYTNPSKVNIVTAAEGKLFFAQNQAKLIMDLTNGEIHESNAGNTTLYRKVLFNHHKIAMNADQFSFQQSTPGGQRGDRELSAQDMSVIVDSLNLIKSDISSSLSVLISRYFSGDSLATPLPQIVSRPFSGQFYNQGIIEKIRNIRNGILSEYVRLDYFEKEINKYFVEIHKKYSIPVACIVFIFLGAPLGVMTRKGGFGMAGSISLFFFLIYWASLIGGEKLADRAIISPFWGMWFANFLIAALGIILTLRVAKETVTLDFSFFKKFIPKNWLAPQESTNETA
ncbi:MAG: YjgP/YjgQ family permease [Ignavibacteriales bacterium]|nr:LptF/LptG family permease [Ignavibacteriaceae bacterium]NLH61877.1 YjgP/YjgQ family permease [Ignavibacteriales bacterium]HOJ17920.1 LptF/LptG family permease [Ignavibacteriaceae bacterium]HPO54973.1 LptF/LptG family permease [Ignavibacteriaceae bacterium]